MYQWIYLKLYSVETFKIKKKSNRMKPQVPCGVDPTTSTNVLHPPLAVKMRNKCQWLRHTVLHSSSWFTEVYPSTWSKDCLRAKVLTNWVHIRALLKGKRTMAYSALCSSCTPIEVLTSLSGPLRYWHRKPGYINGTDLPRSRFFI